jgi:hypothetical protein
MQPTKNKSFKLLVLCVASLALLCSCAIRPPLPSEASMNKGAGNGDQLILMLRLGSGEELPFAVDTGGCLTVIDESLTNKFEQHYGRAVGGGRINPVFEDLKIYNAPKLFLGDTPLVTSPRILTQKMDKLSSRNSVRGILGMDCLRHYCIQLDFVARKIRFLDPDHLDPQELGKAFPLVTKRCPLSGTQVYVDASFFENNAVRFWIDTGFYGDGDFLFQSNFYQQVVRNHQPSWSRKPPKNDLQPHEIAELSYAEFAGDTYAGVKLGAFSEQRLNVPGWMSLHFLSRHLVTFNFPKQMMYLKPVPKQIEPQTSK